MSLEGDVRKQAGLPVNFGGLGCRRVEDIAMPSFLASMNSVGELVEPIISRINIADTNELAEAVESWRGVGGSLLPDDLSRQKAWDLPIVKRNWENMLRVADQVSRARLLATAQRENGAWLNALPVSSFGTLLDSDSFRVAIALRVGADVCISHSCNSGGRMDSMGLHGLSVLEPPGLDSRGGSCPDGKRVFPFSGGRSLVWDFTCVDTFAGVHLNRSAMEAGTAANSPEERKRRKYAALVEAHQFEPIEVETMGVYGESTGVILRAIGHRLVEATG